MVCQGITDLITKTRIYKSRPRGYQNYDTKHGDSSVRIWGRLKELTRQKWRLKQALNSPLLEKSIEGARKMLKHCCGPRFRVG